jgi:hypothetical protein
VWGLSSGAKAKTHMDPHSTAPILAHALTFCSLQFSTSALTTTAGNYSVCFATHEAGGDAPEEWVKLDKTFTLRTLPSPIYALPLLMATQSPSADRPAS